MANYVLAYLNGGGLPEDEEEQRQLHARWGAWFGGLGAAVVDPGNPFGESRSISPDGAVGPGASAGLTGYSIVSADDFDDAVGKAQGCPHLASGGTVEVYEIVPVM